MAGSPVMLSNVIILLGLLLRDAEQLTIQEFVIVLLQLRVAAQGRIDQAASFGKFAAVVGRPASRHFLGHERQLDCLWSIRAVWVHLDELTVIVVRFLVIAAEEF